MSGRSRPQRRWRYIVSALAAALVVAGGLALPLYLPPTQPEFGEIPATTVGPGTTTLVCPAAPTLASATGAVDVAFDLELDTGAPVMEATTRLLSATPLGGGATVGEIGSAPGPLPRATEVETGIVPVVATYPPDDEQAPDVAGLTVGQAEEGDLRGLVAGGCIDPTPSTWLVGGNTEVGSSTQLVVTNPGESPARVRVRTWTGQGPGGEVTELVEPGGATVVLAETIQRTERVAYHVAAEGGQVAAYLLTSTLEGIVPGGVSYVMPGTPPALETLLGPVHLEDFASGQWRTDVRIVNPGEEPALVDLIMLGEAGEEGVAGAQGLEVAPGSVTDIPIAAPAGQYALRVSATAPVAAAVRTITEGEESQELAGRPADLSWLASGHPSDHGLLLAGPGARFALANPEPDPVTATVEFLDEAGASLGAGEVALGGLAAVPIEHAEGAAAVRVSGAIVLASAQYLADAGGPLTAALPAADTGTGSAVIGVVADN